MTDRCLTDRHTAKGLKVLQVLQVLQNVLQNKCCSAIKKKKINGLGRQVLSGNLMRQSLHISDLMCFKEKKIQEGTLFYGITHITA